jgi:non-heme chloroperoxidase
MHALDLHTLTLASGLRLEVAECGRGPAILFLHGYTDSWRSFESIMRRLPDDVRALAPSQRGHGGSDRPASGYTIADFAGDAVALLDAKGIDKATVVGHSMGSLVAQELAIAHPDRVARLVLVGAATTFDNPGVRGLEETVRTLADPVPRAFVEEFQASTAYRPLAQELLRMFVDESLKVPSRVWRDVAAGLLAFRSEDRVAHIQSPTLIVRGEYDEIAPESEEQRLRRSIRGCTVARYADTGHAPHWEQPERFTDELVAFVRDAAATREASVALPVENRPAR